MVNCYCYKDSQEVAGTTEHSQSTREAVSLQQYLVAYVNQELFLDPPIPSQGKALYDVCSDAASLW